MVDVPFAACHPERGCEGSQLARCRLREVSTTAIFSQVMGQFDGSETNRASGYFGRTSGVFSAAVGMGLDMMAAPMVARIDQDLADAGGAQFGEGDLGGVGVMSQFAD
jgi:hypothetical protein